MDYPETDDDGDTQTEAMATGNAILDADDMELGDLATGVAAPDNTRAATCTKALLHTGCSSARGSIFADQDGGDGPGLPPIYLTVRQEREKKMVTRHLNGGAVTGMDSTVWRVHLPCRSGRELRHCW
jgi:hypothetical protein